MNKYSNYKNILNKYMKAHKNLVYFIIFIFHQLKCLDVLANDPNYKNIQLLYEGQLLFLIYSNNQFGDYCVLDDYYYKDCSDYK